MSEDEINVPGGPSELEKKRQELSKLKKLDAKMEKLVNETIKKLETLALKKDCYFGMMRNVKVAMARLKEELRKK